MARFKQSLQDWCIENNRQDLLDEWDYEKNGDTKPCDVARGTTHKVWWKCRYGHEWEASVCGRTHRNNGCSKCSGNGTSMPEQGVAFYLEQVCNIEQRFKVVGQELDIYLPDYKIGIEYDGEYYHKSIRAHNKELEKNRLVYNEGVKLIRIKESDSNNVDGSIVYYATDYMCSNYEWAIRKVLDLLVFLTGDERFHSIDVDVHRDSLNIRERSNLYFRMNSIAKLYPELAKEWDCDKNLSLRPEMFTPGSNIKVWWKCDGCGCEWQADIRSRVRGSKCPYCSHRVVFVGQNDLQTLFPNVAKEWHPTKNGSLRPTDVLSKSNELVWWQCEYGHEWQAAVDHRTDGRGCPICANKKLLRGFNDLQTKYPELAKEWHPIKNGDKKPCDVIATSGIKVWWKCNEGHEWEASVKSRAYGNGCPHCAGLVPKRVLCVEMGRNYNSLTEASKSTKISMSSISCACRGIQQTAGGYHWQFIDDDVQNVLDISCLNKQSKPLNCKIDIQVSDELDAFLRDVGLSKTATVERALMAYIKYYRETGKV